MIGADFENPILFFLFPSCRPVPAASFESERQVRLQMSRFLNFFFRNLANSLLLLAMSCVLKNGEHLSP